MISSKIMRLLLNEYEDDFYVVRTWLDKEGIRMYKLYFFDNTSKDVFIKYEDSELVVVEKHEINIIK